MLLSSASKTNAPPEQLADSASRLSKRSSIDGFMVMDVMRAAAELEARGRSIIHMEVGQPGTPAPARARQAVASALKTETLGYTLALGISSLRERIARHCAHAYGVEVPPERIAITTGSSSGFLLSFLSLFDTGQTVGLPNPGYPCYRQILSALGQRPVLLETGPQNRWMPTPEDIEQAHHAHKLAGVLVASPANPTGTMIEPERLTAIHTVCQRLDIWLVADEIYHGLTYGRPAPSALSLGGDNTVIINSFSKYYSMTGWRVGWMIVPPHMIRTIERLQQNFCISAPAVSQVAALAALEAGNELEANRSVYAANRDLLLRELPEAGFDRIAPADGAFYLYCDVSHLTGNSPDLARDILETAGVAATPGIDFDPVNGHRYLRFSYAGTTADMGEAAQRLKVWAKDRKT